MAPSNKGSTDNYFVPRSNDSMQFLTGTFDDQDLKSHHDYYARAALPSNEDTVDSETLIVYGNTPPYASAGRSSGFSASDPSSHRATPQISELVFPVQSMSLQRQNAPPPAPPPQQQKSPNSSVGAAAATVTGAGSEHRRVDGGGGASWRVRSMHHGTGPSISDTVFYPEGLMKAVNDEQQSSADKKGRGKYKCGRCGAPKVNHVCAFAEGNPVCSVATQVVLTSNYYNDVSLYGPDRVLTVRKLAPDGYLASFSSESCSSGKVSQISLNLDEAEFAANRPDLVIDSSDHISMHSNIDDS